MGLCTNYIEDIAAWTVSAEIRIPVLSDFLTRTTAATLAGLNPDGTARRATLLYAPGGKLVWRHADCDEVDHHLRVVDEMLERSQGRRLAAQGRADGDFGTVPVSVAPPAPQTPPEAARGRLINGW